MLQKGKDGIWRSKLLGKIPGSMHGFSSRHMGDVRKREVRETLLRSVRVSPNRFVSAEQVHGAEVAVVTAADVGRTVPSVDGLVVQNDPQVSLAIGVHVADCVPLLMVDPEAQVIAAVHAGWKGTLKNIAGKAVARMVKLGAKPSHVHACLGPHIGTCCYNVDKDRVDAFRRVFGNEANLVRRLNGSWHLDLGSANYRQLLTAGLRQEHIDAPLICTACQTKEFFSYRRDSQATFGEILAFIGF